MKSTRASRSPRAPRDPQAAITSVVELQRQRRGADPTRASERTAARQAALLAATAARRLAVPALRPPDR
jgi:hypothetical protein